MLFVCFIKDSEHDNIFILLKKRIKTVLACVNDFIINFYNNILIFLGRFLLLINLHTLDAIIYFSMVKLHDHGSLDISR